MIATSTLRDSLVEEADRWSVALPSDLHVSPESLFVVEEHEPSAGLAALQVALLEKGEIPPVEVWCSALAATWSDRRRILGKDAHHFFATEFSDVEGFLDDLGRRLHRVCVSDHETSRMDAHTLLRKIATAQEQERSLSHENRPSYLRNSSASVARLAMFRGVEYWDLRLLCESLKHELKRNQPAIDDLRAGVFLGSPIALTSLVDVVGWFMLAMEEIGLVVESTDRILASLFSSKGDAAKILRVSENLARGQAQLVELALRFGRISTQEEVKGLLREKGSRALDQLIDTYSAMSTKICAVVDAGIEKHMKIGGDLTLDANFEMVFPPALSSLTEELQVVVERATMAL